MGRAGASASDRLTLMAVLKIAVLMLRGGSQSSCTPMYTAVHSLQPWSSSRRGQLPLFNLALGYFVEPRRAFTARARHSRKTASKGPRGTVGRPFGLSLYTKGGLLKQERRKNRCI